MGAIFVFSAIASLGLPGLAGFWGEVFALLAAFNPAEVLNQGLFRTYMVLGAIGTILTAGYMLWLIQRLTLGQVREKWAGDASIDDLRPVEAVAWAPLLVAILALGIAPLLVFEITNDAVVALTQLF
jgi:NADH-quinone oxidoreductase subunit M